MFFLSLPLKKIVKYHHVLCSSYKVSMSPIVPFFMSLSLTRLIKHTKQLLEENEERLCIKVLQTLREMMTKDRGYGEKVQAFMFLPRIVLLET